MNCPICANFTPTHYPLYTNTEPQVISHHCGPNCILQPPCGHTITSNDFLWLVYEDAKGGI